MTLVDEGPILTIANEFAPVEPALDGSLGATSKRSGFSQGHERRAALRKGLHFSRMTGYRVDGGCVSLVLVHILRLATFVVGLKAVSPLAMRQALATTAAYLEDVKYLET